MGQAASWDAHEAAVAMLAAVLDQDRPKPDAALPSSAWVGTYTEPETGLAVRIDPAVAGQVRLRFGHAAEQLDLQADGTAGSTGTRLRPGKDGPWMDRPGDNQRSRLLPCKGTPAHDITGCYRCEELGADLTVFNAGRVLYGTFPASWAKDAWRCWSRSGRMSGFCPARAR